MSKQPIESIPPMTINLELPSTGPFTAAEVVALVERVAADVAKHYRMAGAREGFIAGAIGAPVSHIVSTVEAPRRTRIIRDAAGLVVGAESEAVPTA